MRKLFARLFVALAALAMGAPAFAADMIKTKDGTVYRGTAVSYNRQTEVLTFKTEDGRTHNLRKNDLEHRSAYHLAKSRVPKDDGRGQLNVANYARDIGLYAHAKRHYDQARAADASLAAEIDKEFVVFKRKAAVFCLEKAETALKDNNKRYAERWLTILVEKLPDEPPATRARAMLEEIYLTEHNKKDDHLEQNQDELVKKELKKGKVHYDRMIEKIKNGLLNTRSTSAAKRDFESAWKDGEIAMKELDKTEKKLKGKVDGLAELFNGYRELVTEHMVDAQLHLASLYTSSTSYNRAMKHVNRALAIDASNQKALAARARIENASSNGGWGRWR